MTTRVNKNCWDDRKELDKKIQDVQERKDYLLEKIESLRQEIKDCETSLTDLSSQFQFFKYKRRSLIGLNDGLASHYPKIFEKDS